MSDSSDFPQEQKTSNAVNDVDDLAAMRIPAKNQEKYQQWYENEQHHGKDSKLSRLLWSLKKDRNSPVLSGFILAAISLLAMGLGTLAIHYLPYLSQSQSSYFPSGWRMNSYKKIPVDRIGFETHYVLSVPFDLPRCFCVDSLGRFIVGGDSKIVVVDSNGEKLWSNGLENEPVTLCTPTTGQLFADCLIVGYDDCMEVFRPLEGAAFEPIPFFTWKLPGGTPFLRSIVSTDDFIYITDAGEKLVYRLDEKGFIHGIIKDARETDVDISEYETDEIFSGFVIPKLPFLDIVVSPLDHLLYVTNPGKHRIEAFAKDGTWKKESAWGTPSAYYDGFCGDSNPSGLAVMKNGNFVTAENFIPRVKMFDPHGKFLTVVASTENLETPPLNVKNMHKGAEIKFRNQLEDEIPIRIAITPEQSVVVLDPTYRVLRIYTEK